MSSKHKNKPKLKYNSINKYLQYKPCRYLSKKEIADLDYGIQKCTHKNNEHPNKIANEDAIMDDYLKPQYVTRPLNNLKLAGPRSGTSTKPLKQTRWARKLRRLIAKLKRKNIILEYD